MKRNVIRSLSGLLLTSSMLFIPANASTVSPGWHPHSQLDATRISYEYVLPSGKFATGWCFINGFWYYFHPVDCADYVGTAYKDSKGNWVDTNFTSYTINGKDYFFDNQGRLLTNTDIYQGSAHIKYHLDENGNFQDIYNGNN